ncbi:MAG: CDP-alcohol phosphatidyltransferase family protein [Porticoccaceae bacterium]
MTKNTLNIPNALSALRLLLVPVLLSLAWHQQPGVFLSLLVVSLSTDGFDGYLARRLNQTSALGAKLDTWADFFTYGTMVLGLVWLWPGIFAREAWFLYLAILSYLVPTLGSLLKFKELPSYHTWAAKVAAVLMAPAYFMLVLFDFSLLFRFVVLFHIWVAIEEVIIIATLNRNRYNVPTFVHARQLMRRQRELLRLRSLHRRERRAARRAGKIAAGGKRARQPGGATHPVEIGGRDLVGKPRAPNPGGADTLVTLKLVDTTAPSQGAVPDSPQGGLALKSVADVYARSTT